MNIDFLTQPKNTNNQEITLNEIILNNLNSRNPIFNKIWLVSAFVKNNILSLLIPDIRNSIDNGSELNIILGVDMQGTSYEALIQILNLGVNSHIFKNRLPGHTFHPKIYIFEATGVASEIIIGSNNLTLGGMLSNYEASVRIRYDLEFENDLFQQAMTSLSRFLYPPENISLPLTKELIDIMLERGDIISESASQNNDDIAEVGHLRQHQRQARQNEIESPFGIEQFTFSQRNNRRRQRRIPAQGIHSHVYQPIEELVPNEEGRTILWRKNNLPASDVQRQPGNPTGGLRLTQAQFSVNGEVINQTTYFRNNLFGHMEWAVGANPPFRRETIAIPFEIFIDNRNYGPHILVISHKPTGEAGQGNYTTMLHWGNFGATIQELNLVGKTLTLYSAARDEDIPYRIVIE